MKKMVFKSPIGDEKSRAKAMKAVVECGVDSVTTDMKEGKITVVGEADPVRLAKKLRKLGYTKLLSVEEKKEEKKGAEKKTEEKKPPAEKKKEEKKSEQPAIITDLFHVYPESGYWPYEGYPYQYKIVRDEYPTFCTIM